MVGWPRSIFRRKENSRLRKSGFRKISIFYSSNELKLKRIGRRYAKAIEPTD